LLEVIEEEFIARSHYAKRLEIKTQILQDELATANQLKGSLLKETEELRKILENQQQTLVENFDYAEQSCKLEEELKKLKEELVEKENAQKARLEELTNQWRKKEDQLLEANSALQTNINNQQLELQTLRSDLERKDGSFRKETEMLEKRVADSEHRVQELISQKKDIKLKLQKELDRKNAELTSARAVNREERSSFNQQLQQARMKYEEQLFEVTRELKAGGSNDQNWKKMMYNQKKDYEEQIAKLNRKVASLTNKLKTAKTGSILPRTPTKRQSNKLQKQFQQYDAKERSKKRRLSLNSDSFSPSSLTKK